MKRVACTIVSNNYLAYARVLANSLARHCPDVHFVTLIVDRPSGEIEYETLPFEVLFVQDLIENHEPICFRYSILELNTAVKPALLRHLFSAAGADQLLYLDPDIQVFSDLRPVWSALESASIALTPHVLSPLANDDRTPNEISFLQSGVYNLGFLGLSNAPETQHLLDWWDKRLEERCLHAVETGLFVDQKWMTFGPAYLGGATILRDRGLNVAYWNLPNRNVEQHGKEWRVDGEPLHFFHFSGYDLNDPDRVSKHQDRLDFDDAPSARPLYQQYSDHLMAQGHERYSASEYGFAFFDNGEDVPEFARIVYRRNSDKADRWPRPFSTERGSFHQWLTEIEDEDLARPRFALEVMRTRTDLIAEFPRVPGENEPAFAAWMATQATTQYKLASPWLDQLDDYHHHSNEAETPGTEIRTSNRSEKSPKGLPDHLFLLHQGRPDLREAFPDPRGSDRRRFLFWWVTKGSLELGMPFRRVSSHASGLPLPVRLTALAHRLRRELFTAGVPQ